MHTRFPLRVNGRWAVAASDSALLLAPHIILKQIQLRFAGKVYALAHCAGRKHRQLIRRQPEARTG